MTLLEEIKFKSLKGTFLFINALIHGICSKIKLDSLKKCLLLLKMFDSPAFNLTVTSNDDLLIV